MALIGFPTRSVIGTIARMTLGWTRRELMQMFLGSAAAWAGCSQPAPPPLPDGELVGPAPEFGHRLRDRQLPDLRPERWEQTRVLIIGGGIAGLTAARRFAQSGLRDVWLVESEPRLGGTSVSGTSPISSFPWGAHYVPVPLAENDDLIELFDEMQLLEDRRPDGTPVVREQFLCRDPQERVFYKGNWYEGLYLAAGASSEDRAQLERFRSLIADWVRWRDAEGRRAFAIPMTESSRAPEVLALDAMTMSEWLDQHGLTSERLRWYVNYACRDDYGLTMDLTSAWAGVFYFASRVPEAGDDAQPFITWPEGNGRIVAHLRRFQPESQTLAGWMAVRITPRPAETGGGVEAVLLQHGGNAIRGIRAERIVFAAPQFLAPYLIDGYLEKRGAVAKQFRYGPWMVANLFLRDRPFTRGFPLSWDNVLYESPGLGYVVATHQSCIDYGPTVFTYYYPLCDADERHARQLMLQTDRAEWADIVLADLQVAHPDIRTLCERIDVARWGHAMIQPRRGFLWSGARERGCEPFGPVHFAHCDLSGLALMEEAFSRGNAAADAVLRQLPHT